LFRFFLCGRKCRRNFSDLYPVMQTDLTNFEATVDAGWNGVQTNCH
jgi:hypothetical protein